MSPGETRVRVSANGALPEVISVQVPDRGEVEASVHLRAVGAGKTVSISAIGAALKESGGGLLFTEVAEGSAAAKAGIAAGDRLVTVDFRQAAQLQPEEVAAAIDTALAQQATLEVIGPDGARRSVYVSP